MGFLKNLFGTGEPIEEHKRTSLVEKLKEAGIDFYGYTHEGEPMEISLDDELRGATRATSRDLENNFFTNSFFYDYKDGRHTLLMLKDKPTERDYKDFVDKASPILGPDWLFRNEFTTRDLSKLRGEDDSDLDEPYKSELRGWEDKISGYTIRVGFGGKEEKYLKLIII